jgi:ADP-heptose:LPS heptosyltransferase
MARHLSGPATPAESWNKGILIGANHIGDILYRTSSLAQLAKGLPSCRWDFLAPDPSAQVLEGNPAIGKIQRMEIPMPGSRDFQLLKAEGYDVAICYDSGSYARPLLSATLLGIPNRVAYVHKGFSGLVTHPVAIQYPQSYPAYFRDLVAQLTHCDPQWDLRPSVFPNPDDELAAQTLWDEFENEQELPVVACFVTTRQPSTLWTPDQFTDALKSLHSLRPVRIILCGSAEDKDILQTMGIELGFHCFINAGRINLKALVSFLRKCSVVLTTDSGPRHLANAAGVPVVYLRNLLSQGIETGSYLTSEHDLVPPAENPGNLRHKTLISPEITPEMAAKRIVELLPN